MEIDEPYSEPLYPAAALASYPLGLGMEQLRGRRRYRKTFADYMDSGKAEAEHEDCLGRLSVQQLALFNAWVSGMHMISVGGWHDEG